MDSAQSDPSLWKWLDSAFGISLLVGRTFYEDSTKVPSAQSLTEDDKLLFIGKELFDLSENASLTQITTELQEIYYEILDGPIKSNKTLAELMLAQAVSKRNPHQSAFLQGILKLDQEVQERLKDIVIKHAITIFNKQIINNKQEYIFN